MPNLHIAVGDSNTRKSSLVRCLTGVGSGRASRYLEVAERSGAVITVYCMVSALQEQSNPRTPAEFISFIRGLKPQVTDVLFTLRVSAVKHYPAVASYVSAFGRVGWPIVNVALLGGSASSLGTVFPASRVCAVPVSPSQPTNQTASQVRKVWGWM